MPVKVQQTNSQDMMLMQQQWSAALQNVASMGANFGNGGSANTSMAVYADANQNLETVTANAKTTPSLLSQMNSAIPSFNVNGLAYGTGAPITNLKFVNANGTSAGTGDLNLYTVPTNRAALVSGMHFYNPTASTISLYGEVYINGLYYGLGNSTSVGASQAIDPGNNIAHNPIVLTAGQTLAVHTGTAAGLITWGNIWEFDAPAALKSPMLFPANTISGNYTLYKCPVGKTAKLVQFGSVADLSNVASSVTGGLFVYGGISGSTSTYNVYLVPNGGTPSSTTNQYLGQFTTATQTGSKLGMSMALNTGDSIVVNTTASSNQAMIWVNLVEY
jgi:hypothetical protein